MTITVVATIPDLKNLTPAAGDCAYLTEDGRQGMFVFDSADLSTAVNADPSMGIYVAPSSDTTGDSGAWIRNYVGCVYLEWFGGGISAVDNKDAWDAIVRLLPECKVQLDPGTYAISLMAFPTMTNQGIVVQGAGRNATTILITGDGGGVPGAGANGGVRMFGYTSALFDLQLQYNNPSLHCLLNISSSLQAGRISIGRVDFAPTGLTASQISCTAIYLQNVNSVTISECLIGATPNFSQDMVIRGFWSSCSVHDVTFRPHARDAANGVWCSENFLLDVNASTQSSQVYDNTFEQGPNGAKVVGQGSISFRDNYFADATPAVGFWLPSTAYHQEDLVYPSASITATSDGSTALLTSVSSTATLYVGQRIVGIGMAALAQPLTARISAISGTTVTLDGPTGTAVVGGSVYYGTYSQHGYISSVAGTSGTSPPTWPTTVGTTVADGTVMWRDHASCAWIDMNTDNGTTAKEVLLVSGGIMFSNVMGVLARRGSGGGGQPGSVIVEGVSFNAMNHCGKIDGALSAVVRGCRFRAYTNFGFQVAGENSAMRDILIAENNDSTSSPAATFVVSTNSTNVAGEHHGITTLTGIGARQLTSYNTNPVAGPGITMPGSLLSSSSSGGNGYSTGAGGTITQSSNKGAAVTLNKICGQITTANAALAAGSAVNFTFNNSTVGGDDRMSVWVKSGYATPGTYSVRAEGNMSGSRTIILKNESGGSLGENVVIGFDVMKVTSS